MNGRVVTFSIVAATIVSLFVRAVYDHDLWRAAGFVFVAGCLMFLRRDWIEGQL